MWLKYIKLENYDFFLTGMDKNIIEMNFEKDDDIIVISGDNGSGKTTFAKLAYTPYPKIDNSYGIIKNKAGKKIQVFVDEKYEREIEIIHNFNPKKDTHACDSYLNVIENGVKRELNKNGSVRSFYDLVDEYFGITRDNNEVLYTAVKQLGLVTKTSAERREYVKGIIDGLEEIDERYKIVNNKYSVIKKELKANEIKLKNYPDSDELKTDIKEIKKLVNIKKSELKNTHKKMGTLENIKEKDLDKIKQKINKYNRDISDAKRVINVLNKLNSDKSLKYNVDEFSGFLKRNKDRLKEIEEEIKSKNKGLINLEKDSNGLIKLKEDSEYIKSLGVRLDDLDEEIKNIETEYDYEEYSNIKPFVNNVLTSLDMLSSNIIDMRSLKDDIHNKIKHYGEEIVKLKEEQTIYQQELDSLIGSYGGMFDGNIKPHVDCEFKGCDLRIAFDGYVTHIDEVNNISNNLDKIENKIETLKDKIKILENDIKWKERYNNLISKLKEYDDLLIKDKDFKKISVNNILNTLKTGKHLKLMDIYSVKFDKMDKYFKYMDDKKRYESFTSMSKKENDLLERYKNEKEKILKKREELTEKRKNIEEKILDYEKKLDKLDIELDNVLVKNLNIESLEEIILERKELIKESKEKLNDMMNTIENKKTLEKEEELINKELKSYENKVDKLNQDLTIMKHLEKEFIRLNEEERITYAIREALRLHLPVTLIDSFLESVKLYANKFLKDAKLEYRISDFEITENIFRIEAMKKNHIYSDVSNMSDGEICFMSLAISFAILVILKPLQNYKITALDEMDSLLKDERKKKYMDIVVSQFKNFDLSQMFIVTHNEYFNDLNNVSHICLKDSTVDKFDKSKRIIYHYET